MANDEGIVAATAAGYSESDLHGMIKDHYADHHREFDCYPDGTEIYSAANGDELDDPIWISHDECSSLLDKFGWQEPSAATLG
jgi:hypothetical protein